MIKKDIKNFSFGKTQYFLKKNKFQSFRAKQITNWLRKKNVSSFEEMKNLPKKLIDFLKNNFFISNIEIKDFQKSEIDDTVKFLFQLSDNQEIEGVLIPSKNNRITACISTQVACILSCKFCATGQLKFQRNLFFHEIYEQVFILNEKAKEIFGKHLSNIVIMGMGEPLLNYENTMEAIDLMMSEKEGLGISHQRITLSTVGISDGIKQLADDNFKCNLAISLHTANEIKRKHITNSKDNLDEIKDSIEYFYEKTKKRITYEYILFDKFNDSLEDAKKLANFCKISPCKINLIEYNPTNNDIFSKSTEKNTKKFMDFLSDKNLIVNLRKSKGQDILASCGQLANSKK